ncbi:MAG: hypothetical protein ACI4EQ_03405 [Lachnospiraceae bacterium]
MMKLLESWGAGTGSFVENGQYLALFLVALLFLWLSGEKIKKEFVTFSFAVGLLILCPVTARILLVYQTVFFDYETVWELLPLTALLAYGLVMAFAKMSAVLTREDRAWKATISGKKGKVYESLAVGALVVLLFMSGTVSLAENITEKTDRTDRLPARVGEVLDLLEISGDETITLAAPEEIVEWARLYSGNILLPYGRDMDEEGLTAYLYDKYTADIVGLYEWIQGTLPAPTLAQEAYLQEETYVEQCAAAGYDYLIFDVERANNDLLAYALENCGGYRIFARTDEYVIYSR